MGLSLKFQILMKNVHHKMGVFKIYFLVLTSNHVYSVVSNQPDNLMSEVGGLINVPTYTID